MSEHRWIGIPGDTIVHNDLVYGSSANVPKLWGMLMLKIDQVHARGITGKGARISINDTGVARHDFLPSPVFQRDFTGNGNGDRNGHGGNDF
jgi:hypothetical protein